VGLREMLGILKAIIKGGCECNDTLLHYSSGSLSSFVLITCIVLALPPSVYRGGVLINSILLFC
jgi:hypothetical protein